MSSSFTGSRARGYCDVVNTLLPPGRPSLSLPWDLSAMKSGKVRVARCRPSCVLL